jgi:transmembrane protein
MHMRAAKLMNARWFAVLARVLVTFPYWSSGISKTVDFQAGVAEMTLYGLHPPLVFNIAVIVCMLLGSALVIANRAVWVGAGALGVFTALTIPIVHDFWTMSGEEARTELFFVVEHIGLIGGLMLAALLSHRPGRETASENRQRS